MNSPTLSDLVEHPERASDLSPQVLAARIIELGALQSRFAVEILSRRQEPEEEILKAAGAAKIVGVHPVTMSRWLRRAPFSAAVAYRSGRLVRVSKRKLLDILASGGRTGRRRAELP